MAPSPQSSPSMYETSQSDSPPSFKKTPVAVLVVVCLCIALAVLLISFLCWRARRKELSGTGDAVSISYASEPELENHADSDSRYNSWRRTRDRTRAWIKTKGQEKPQISLPRPLSDLSTGSKAKEEDWDMKGVDKAEGGRSRSRRGSRSRTGRGKGEHTSGDVDGAARIGYGYAFAFGGSGSGAGSTSRPGSRRHSSSSNHHHRHHSHRSRAQEREELERRRLDSITDKDSASGVSIIVETDSSFNVATVRRSQPVPIIQAAPVSVPVRLASPPPVYVEGRSSRVPMVYADGKTFGKKDEKGTEASLAPEVTMSVAQSTTSLPRDRFPSSVPASPSWSVNSRASQGVPPVPPSPATSPNVGRAF